MTRVFDDDDFQERYHPPVADPYLSGGANSDGEGGGDEDQGEVEDTD